MASSGHYKRTAWFSSSVPKSEVEIWIKSGCAMEEDPFEADFLFSENSEAADVQRIFKSQEYLEGHLTVFSSDIIAQSAEEGVITRLDVKNCILLPKKLLNDLGFSGLCLKEDGVSKARKDHCLLPRYKRNYKQTCSSSKNTKTRGKVSERACTMETKSAEQCSCSDDSISEFSSTPPSSPVPPSPVSSPTSPAPPSPSSPAPPLSLKPPPKVKTFDSRHCGMFCHSLNFEITHLDDIDVPPFQLTDFKPGVDGCQVVKRSVKFCGMDTT